MNSPEIEHQTVDRFACGYYLNTVTSSGDFVELLIPGTLVKNSRPLNSAIYLDNVKVRNNNGGLNAVLKEMVKFKSRAQIKKEMAPRLESLRNEGFCK